MADVQIPILKDTKDPHYRYKMPKLTAKVEGSGNGIKTVITNMTAIARALNRPASYPTKYFGCELGAQVTMANDAYIVNGSHDADKLLNLLYGFIRRFVLCPKCNNPETSLSVVNGSIKQKCIACGHSNLIPKSVHKLATYIISHPPSGGTPSAEVKVSSKKMASGKKPANGTTASVNASERNGLSSSPPLPDDANDDDAFDDDELSESAYLERLHDSRVNGIGFVNDPKKSADVFFKLVKQKRDENLLVDVNVQKELFEKAELLGIKDKATLILGELLFTENIVQEIGTYRLLFLRFCNENPKAQKYLLGAFEKLVGDVYQEKLFPQATKILKQMYDQDVLDEEVIIEWAGKESKKYVSKTMSKQIREKVAPLVKWLKEADVDNESSSEEEEGGVNRVGNGGSGGAESANSDDSGETTTTTEKKDDDEDDEDFEFSHRVSGIRLESAVTVKLVPTANAPNASAAVNGVGGKQEEEDIDIDNI